MAREGARLRTPPRIKVLEALGAIADGRIAKTGENTYLVRSSDGSRSYNVYVDMDKKVVFSNDNGTKYRGYIGYPIIAALMMEKIIGFDKSIADSLKGLPWKKLNEKYKKYIIVENIVLKKLEESGIPKGKVLSFINRVLRELSTLEIVYSEKFVHNKA